MSSDGGQSLCLNISKQELEKACVQDPPKVVPIQNAPKCGSTSCLQEDFQAQLEKLHDRSDLSQIRP